MSELIKELRDGRAGAIGIAAADEIEQLRFALDGLYEDVLDYQRMNRLGGYNNHWMRAARIALHRPADSDEIRRSVSAPEQQGKP